MLVLSRKPGEKIVINDNITITVVAIIGNRVKIGIEAPDQVSILRGELIPDPEVAEFRDQWTAEDGSATAKTDVPEQPTARTSAPTALMNQPLLHARIHDSLRRLRQLPR